jgi:hypothetical protein
MLLAPGRFAVRASSWRETLASANLGPKTLSALVTRRRIGYRRPAPRLLIKPAKDLGPIPSVKMRGRDRNRLGKRRIVLDPTV